MWSMKTLLTTKVQRAIALLCLWFLYAVQRPQYLALGKSTVKGPSRGNVGSRDWKSKEDVNRDGK